MRKETVVVVIGGVDRKALQQWCIEGVSGVDWSMPHSGAGWLAEALGVGRKPRPWVAL